MNQDANTATRIAASSCLLLLTLITTACTASPPNTPKPIRLTNGTTIPDIILPPQATPTALFAGRYFKLIQFTTIPDDAQRTAWASNGLHLVDYLPDNTYFAVIDQQFDLTQLTAVTIIDVDARFKVADTLGEKPAQLTVSYYGTLDASLVIADLRARGIAVTNHRPYARQLDITIDPAQFDALVALPYLQFIDAAPDPGTLEEPPSPSSP